MVNGLTSGPVRRVRFYNARDRPEAGSFENLACAFMRMNANNAV
jgi:hypothetical protein